jgi:hypothetical protein
MGKICWLVGGFRVGPKTQPLRRGDGLATVLPAPNSIRLPSVFRLMKGYLAAESPCKVFAVGSDDTLS